MSILMQLGSEYPGNLGDEAINRGVIENVNCDCGVLVKDPDKRSYLQKTGATLHPIDEGIPDGYDEFWFCGGDVVDGVYDHGNNLKLLQEAADRMPTRVIGFSWSESPSKKAVNIIKGLKDKVDFYVRDEYSYYRFTCETGIVAEVTSDLAFLIEPASKIPNFMMTHGLERVLTSPNPLIVSNATYFEYSNTTCIKRYAELLNSLIKKHDANIVLVPHDTRDWSDDLEAIHNISQLLDSKKCLTYYHGNDPRIMMHLCSKANLVLSGRLHLAIFSLSGGTPVVGIDYNDKMKGIFKQFDLENLVVDSLDEMEKKANLLLTNQDVLGMTVAQQNIADNIDFVRKQARRNLFR